MCYLTAFISHGISRGCSEGATCESVLMTEGLKVLRSSSTILLFGISSSNLRISPGLYHFHHPYFPSAASDILQCYVAPCSTLGLLYCVGMSRERHVESGEWCQRSWAGRYMYYKNWCWAIRVPVGCHL